MATDETVWMSADHSSRVYHTDRECPRLHRPVEKKMSMIAPAGLSACQWCTGEVSAGEIGSYAGGGKSKLARYLDGEEVEWS